MPQLKRGDRTHQKTLATAATTVALSLASLSMSSSEALASGFSSSRFGGEHGHPTTSNATAIYFNPAGITQSEGIHIYLDGTVAFRSATYEHRPGGNDIDEPGDAQGANVGEATLFNVVAAPMLGVTGKFGDFAVGVGFYVPFGGISVWDKNEAFEGNTTYPGPEDGIQRWYTIEGTLRSDYITMAAAYHIEPARLSLGVSGNLVLSTIDTIRARTSDGSNDIKSEGRSYLDVTGVSASFGVGALFEAIPKALWIGASYQSRPNVSGGMTLEGTLTNKFGRGEATEGDAKMTQDLPDIIRLGARYRVMDSLELRLFGDISRWSAFKDQCISAPENECEINDDGSEVTPGTVTQNIPRRWDDAFSVRGGVSYFPKPSVEIFSGLGYDGSPVPDRTLDPGLEDFHDVMVALGGRVQVVEKLHVALSYTHIFYIQRDTTGKSELSEFAAPSTVPDAGGIYNQTIGFINANVEVAF